MPANRSKVIGEINGNTVYGEYFNEDGVPSVVVIELNGWRIESDGDWIWFPIRGDEVGHMTVADWQRMKELAQTDTIEQLIETGRQWKLSPPIGS